MLKRYIVPYLNMDNFCFGKKKLALYLGDLKFSQICNFQSKIDFLPKNHDTFMKLTEKKIQNF